MGARFSGKYKITTGIKKKDRKKSKQKEEIKKDGEKKGK